MVTFEDFATGKTVREGSEESVRQQWERVLHSDFDYPLECMDIEVALQRGSTKRERADLVIYTSGDLNERDQSRHIMGIFEFKSPKRADGIQQLKSYMTATSCLWGAWTNGKELEMLYKDPTTGVVNDNVLFHVPRFGQPIAEIGLHTFQDLRPATNLKLIFRRLLNELYTNTNISRREKLGNEMTKLLFCKLQDEQFKVGRDTPQFRTNMTDNEDGFSELRERINGLFRDVKAQLAGEGVFDQHDKITLDNKSIAYVVGELQNYSLTRTDEDVVGSAFEVFAESKFAGEQGEFFTPREVVLTAIRAIDPRPGETIIDPACGSGGFLISALHHIWEAMETDPRWRDQTPDKFLDSKRQVAQQTIYGLDKEADLVRIAKAYMAIIGDGKSRIAQANSLHSADRFHGPARDLIVDDGALRQFDIVLTNPPFGSKETKVSKADSSIFDLGHKWSNKKGHDEYQRSSEPRSAPAQELFIERCIELLKPDGRMAIILPETYGHAPTKQFIRQYIEQYCIVDAVIDLPHNTFRPHCNAKTLLWIVTKRGATKTHKRDIIFAAAEEMGRDHHGKTKYRVVNGKITDEVWNDLPQIREEWTEPAKLSNKYVGKFNASDIEDGIYVPRYYLHSEDLALELEAERCDYELVSMEELVSEGALKFFRGHGAPPNQYKGLGSIPYVRVGDIGNWAIYHNPTAAVPRHIYKEKMKDRELKPEDVVFVHDGSYRIGDVGIVLPRDVEILLDSHCLVFRVSEDNRWGIDGLELAYLLRHDMTRRQLPPRVFINTTLPDIGSRWRTLRLPILRDTKERERIRAAMRGIYDRRMEAENMILELLPDEEGYEV